MRVAVVGSGIGGLCTAIGLQQAGAEVTVFERSSPQSRPEGFGLSLFANGLRALDIIGMGEAVRVVSEDSARTIRGGQRRPDGRWLATYPPESVAELRVVERASLHALLRAALEPATLRLAHEVRSTDPDGTVVVEQPDGEVYEGRYDLVVGADGLRSTVRRSWPDDPGTQYAGYAAWRAITRCSIFLHGEAGETWGPGRRFGMAPLADGRVYWFASARMPESAPLGDQLAAAQALFGGWHAPIPEVLSSTAAEDVQRLPIYSLAGELASYRRGRIVLLGDAAHAMTPDLGQGGGQAMEDAATLSTLLAPAAGESTPDGAIERALGAYDAARRPRSQAIARRSLNVGRAAHLRGRFSVSIRDAIIRATPDAALGRQLRELQRWAVPTP